jgi:uncharacterized membrane protein YhaH (DUF805 family)
VGGSLTTGLAAVLGASRIEGFWPVVSSFVAILVVGIGPIALGVYARRKHDRQFPSGFDRTGWEPREGHAGRFATMWAWLAGGRGST